MFFQKVFHVHKPLAETRRQLSRVAAFRAQLPGVKKAVFTADGVAQFECEVDPFYAMHAVLVELPCEEENAVLFHSTVGNVRVAGMVALCPIRPGLTEVRITVDYCLRSLLARTLDFFTHRVEHYVDKALHALQECVDSQTGGWTRPAGLTPRQLQPAH
jgi:hypothetical protein